MVNVVVVAAAAATVILLLLQRNHCSIHSLALRCDVDVGFIVPQ